MYNYLKKIFIVLMAFFLSFTSGLQAQVGDDENQSLEKVTLQLRWLHQFQFAGYYMAKEKGFYAEEGLDVNLLEGGPGKVGPIESVMSGNADFSISTSEALYQKLNGQPLMAVSVIFQHAPLIFLTKKSSGITSPHDLVGKRVMTLEGFSNVSLIAMLRNEGVNLDDITFIPQTFNINDLINDNVDAISAYKTNQPFRLAQQGIETIQISPTNYGIDFYSDVLFGREDNILANRERTEAFVRASLKGWKYARENVEETIEIIKNIYGTEISREALAFEAREMEKLMLADVIELGHMNEGRFQYMADLFIEHEMAPADAKLENFVFDPEQIRRNEQNNLISRLSIALGALVLIVFTFFFYSWWLKQKQIEAKKFSKAKSKFLLQLSHEFRTPLNTIMGFSEFINKEMAGEIQNKKYKDYAQIIHKSGNHLLTMLNDLNDLTKIESDKMKINNQKVVISHLLADAVRGFELEAKKNGISIILEPLDESVCLLGDNSLLFQVLLNLISNACKFTESGGVITIKTSIESDGGLQIIIQDTGIGIKPENIDHIFESFGQLPNPLTKQDTHGSGLGLSLVDSLVSLHEGTFKIESIWGEGTRAILKFPLKRLKRVYKA